MSLVHLGHSIAQGLVAASVMHAQRAATIVVGSSSTVKKIIIAFGGGFLGTGAFFVCKAGCEKIKACYKKKYAVEN